MCDVDMPNTIEWEGWTTTWGILKNSGWEVTRRIPHWKCEGISYEKIYIRNKKTCYVGRLTVDPWKLNEASVATLDFLTHERNQRKKPLPVIIEELEAQDIPALYQAILRLQRGYPKPPKENKVLPLPMAKRLTA